MSLARTGDALRLDAPVARSRVGAVADLAAVERDQVRVRHQVALGRDVHGVELRADQVEVLEGHRPALLDHHPGEPAERAQPFAELLGVGDRGRQAHHGDRERQVDEDLLPHGAAVGVLQVVHLVHHDQAEAVERVARLVEHVPKDLGGHDHHRRVAVDRVVAREQANATGAPARGEVAELLVRERLQRRGVEGLAPGGERTLDAVLGHHGLPRSGRRRDQYRLAGLQGPDRAELEVVERERVALREAFDAGHGAKCRGGVRPTPRRRRSSSAHRAGAR